jgi:hypothetical protein
MDQWSKVDYSLIAPEASMAMKITSGGDSPLRQDAGKSFWTLPISGRRRWRIAISFWNSDRVFRFFPSRGLYRRRSIIRSGPGRPHTLGVRPGPGLHRPTVWAGPGPPLTPLRFSRSFGKFLDVWLLFRPIPRIFFV